MISYWLAFCDCAFSLSALWCPLSAPTILLGFLLPWTWGISSWLLQQSEATDPYLGCGVCPQDRHSWSWMLGIFSLPLTAPVPPNPCKLLLRCRCRSPLSHRALSCTYHLTWVSLTTPWSSKEQNNSRKSICFIDYAKAFDCVDHNKLWKILNKMRIPDHLTCLLRNLYAAQEATVKTGHGTTDWFQRAQGAHQGCVLSPCLFNLCAEYIMRNAGLEKAQVGIKIARRNISNLR